MTTCTCGTFSTPVVFRAWNTGCPAHGEGSPWHERVVAHALRLAATREAEAVPVDDLPVEPMSDAELGAFMRAMGRDPETGGRL